MKKIVLICVLPALAALIFWGVWAKAPKPANLNSPIPEQASQVYLFLGDSGTGDLRQKQVTSALKNYCQTHDCQAIFLLGDVIYDRGVSGVDDPLFAEKFETPYQDLNLPFYIAFGNHDYLGCTKCYFDYAAGSGKWKMPAPYYRQSFADVDFFVLDTEAFDQNQADWLSDEIAQSQSRFKIAVGHRPLVTYEEEHAGENWPGKEKLAEVVCQTADVYLAGHAHLLEDPGQLEDCRVRQLVSGGGGASPRHILPEHHDVFVYEGNGFIALSVAPEKLKVEFINSQGDKIYSLAI